MVRISNPLKHMLTALFTMAAIAGITWWAIRPIEWRPHLFNLFNRAFDSFTKYLGTNGPGWIVSVLLSSIFTIILTVVLVGLFRGWTEMRRHWIETAAIGILCILGQIIILYGPIYLRKVTETVYADHGNLVSSIRSLRENTGNLIDPKSRDGQIAELTKQVEGLKKTLRDRESPEIRVFSIARDLRPGVPKMEYVLTTGKTRIPIEIVATCDFTIAQFDVLFLTATAPLPEFGPHSEKLSPTQAKITIQSPAWSPSVPLFATVLFEGKVDRMPSCKFAVQ